MNCILWISISTTFSRNPNTTTTDPTYRVTRFLYALPLFQELWVTIHSPAFGNLCSHSTCQQGWVPSVPSSCQSPQSVPGVGWQLLTMSDKEDLGSITTYCSPTPSFLLIITNSHAAFQANFFFLQKALVNLIP